MERRCSLPARAWLLRRRSNFLATVQQSETADRQFVRSISISENRFSNIDIDNRCIANADRSYKFAIGGFRLLKRSITCRRVTRLCIPRGSACEYDRFPRTCKPIRGCTYGGTPDTPA